MGSHAQTKFITHLEQLVKVVPRCLWCTTLLKTVFLLL